MARLDFKVADEPEDQNLTTGKVQKRKKKRKDPPLPEYCSPSDVLYREIRNLLGENVVDEITEAGNAFKSPYSHGEEIVVKIETIGSGGQSFDVTSFAFLILFWSIQDMESPQHLVKKDHGPSSSHALFQGRLCVFELVNGTGCTLVLS